MYRGRTFAPAKPPGSHPWIAEFRTLPQPTWPAAAAFLDGPHGERDGDDVAVGQVELAPEPVGAAGRERDVEAQRGPELLPGEGEYGPASGVVDLGVLVLERSPVGAHHHEVAGG